MVDDTEEREKSVSRCLLVLNHGGIGDIRGDVSNLGMGTCREEKIDLALGTKEVR